MVAARDLEAGRFERLADAGLAVDEDARRDQCPAGDELVGEGRGVLDQDAGDQVRQHGIERARLAWDRAVTCPHPFADTVVPCVGESRLDGNRVDVDADGPRRPELDCGNRQDPRAAANIEHAAKRAGLGTVLEPEQADARGRVQARAEGLKSLRFAT